MASSVFGKDEARLVRLEIPPMMRYCAGTCPCTWVTAISLPNLVYCYKIWNECNKETNCDREIFYETTLTGSYLQEEINYLKALIPAQSLMGLSSYFAWYYGYGFYGPAKYSLLIYGITLACHSSAHLSDITSNNTILIHRAVCAFGTLLCSISFMQVSKLASMLMLPSFSVYSYLTYLTWVGKSGDTNRNNQETEFDFDEDRNVNNRTKESKKKRRTKKRSILRSGTAKRQRIKPMVSFSDAVDYQCPKLVSPSSSSSSSSNENGSGVSD